MSQYDIRSMNRTSIRQQLFSPEEGKTTAKYRHWWNTTDSDDKKNGLDFAALQKFKVVTYKASEKDASENYKQQCPYSERQLTELYTSNGLLTKRLLMRKPLQKLD